MWEGVFIFILFIYLLILEERKNDIFLLTNIIMLFIVSCGKNIYCRCSKKGAKAKNVSNVRKLIKIIYLLYLFTDAIWIRDRLPSIITYTFLILCTIRKEKCFDFMTMTVIS